MTQKKNVVIAKKNPLVCIVIVNWNGGDKIVNCLKSLNITFYNNYRVILVDNGSSDNSVDQLKKIIPGMDVIFLDKNYGYTIGTNIGWKYSLDNYNPRYICAMDSDIVTIQEEWLNIQIDELEKRNEFMISSGKLLFPDGRIQLLYSDRKPKEYNEIDSGKYDFVKEVTAVGGACIIIKSELIKKIGFYDENYFYGPNDVDYCLRARRKGYKIIYNGFSKSIHVGSFSYLSSMKDMIYEKQAEGQLVFSYRHDNYMKKIKLSLQELLRAYLTRKDPYSKLDMKNIYFHKTIMKRTHSYFKALNYAINNYKYVKNDDHSKAITTVVQA